MPKTMDLVKQALQDEEGAREDVRREMAEDKKVEALAAIIDTVNAGMAAQSMAKESACAQAAAAWEKSTAVAVRIQRFYRLRKSIRDWWEEYWDKKAAELEAEIAEMEAEREAERERDWSQDSCRVCGRPCDDDWGWTGHCSRYCARSYDRRGW